MKNIPSVDLSDFLSDNLIKKQKFIKEITKGKSKGNLKVLSLIK